MLSPEHRQEGRVDPLKRFLLEATPEAFTTWMGEHGHPAYRVQQVFKWAIQHRAESFDQMSDLPRALRQRLQENWSVFSTRVVHRYTSPDGTSKLLIECQDGRRIECVLMTTKQRHTVCISSQVGCGMGCIFCASGLNGLERSLSVGEIVEQVVRLQNLLPGGKTVTHIVVMGMGESLANLANLVAALDLLCSPQRGLGISQRRVTISTVGLPKKIRELAALNRQYHLAVSLHAATEELRSRLVPLNEKTSLQTVVQAADLYFAMTGRQVTYEYVLLHGINDRLEDAQSLSLLLKGRKAHVNLIPYNPVMDLPFSRPPARSILQFVSVLRARGISATVRKTKGRSIEAACGQLRRRLDETEIVQLESDSIPSTAVDVPQSLNSLE
jgi:23S rRNA (adenine2503-C2)-methyltransferase